LEGAEDELAEIAEDDDGKCPPVTNIAKVEPPESR
jgi:hypothetical protein